MLTTRQFITPAELRELTALQPWRTAMALALDWITIFAVALTGIYFDSWPVYLIAIFIIGARQHALAILMHDLAHYRFIKNKTLTKWFSDILIAWPLLGTYEGYKNNHLGHHRFTNTDDDPDWKVCFGTREFTFPQEMRFAILHLLGYLVAINSIRDMRTAIPRLLKHDMITVSNILGRIVFYSTVAVAITTTQTWKPVLLYWFVPYMTFFFMFMYIRAVAEHFGSTMDYSNELTGTRTTIVGPIERFVFAPHNVSFHADHHMFPSVPFYRLRALHEKLMANPAYAKHAHITYGFTTGLWRELIYRFDADKQMDKKPQEKAV